MFPFLAAFLPAPVALACTYAVLLALALGFFDPAFTGFTFPPFFPPFVLVLGLPAPPPFCVGLLGVELPKPHPPSRVWATTGPAHLPERNPQQFVKQSESDLQKLEVNWVPARGNTRAEVEKAAGSNFRMCGRGEIRVYIPEARMRKWRLTRTMTKDEDARWKVKEGLECRSEKKEDGTRSEGQ